MMHYMHFTQMIFTCIQDSSLAWKEIRIHALQKNYGTNHESGHS